MLNPVMKRPSLPVLTAIAMLAAAFPVTDSRGGLRAGEPSTACAAEACATEEIELSEALDPDRITRLTCRVEISGKVRTPAKDGTADWDLSSQASFQFDQRRFASESSGPFAIRAARRFSEARTSTQVASDHRTSVVLPESSRVIHIYGAESGLIQLSPEYRLTRPQVDLLQIPCDPLMAAGLLPSRTLSDSREKWNCDPWVVPLLVGIDAAVTQSATCSLKSVDADSAVIRFECEATGAVTGSSTEIKLTGEMTIDRRQRLISHLQAELVEKRSPGTISPGLDATARIEWTQETVEKEAAGTGLPDSLPEAIPDERRLLLTLATPWRVLLSHSRDWHVFHETADMVMLRMLKNGSLVAQCNMSSAPQVRAGEFTEEPAYLAEVERALSDRGGRIVDSRVETERKGWRVHRVSCTGTAADKELLWDYCLCTAATGEQVSLVFSRANEDSAAFGDTIDQMLSSLTIRPARSKVALPR